MLVLIHQPSNQMVAKLPTEGQSSLYEKLSKQAAGFVIANATSAEQFSDDMVIWFEYDVKEARKLYENCRMFEPEDLLDDGDLEEILEAIQAAVLKSQFYLPTLDNGMVKQIVAGTCATFKVDISKPNTTPKTKQTVNTPTKQKPTKQPVSAGNVYVVGPTVIKRASGVKIMQEICVGGSKHHGELVDIFLTMWKPKKEKTPEQQMADANYFIKKALKDGAILVEDDEL